MYVVFSIKINVIYYYYYYDYYMWYILIVRINSTKNTEYKKSIVLNQVQDKWITLKTP